MATPYSNVNLSGMNRKQLRHIARQVGVSTVTEQSALTTPAQLVTAIQAK